MAPYKKKTATEAQPILAGRRNNTLKEAAFDQLQAIAGLIVSTLAQGNAVYLTPGRFGGLQFKVYIEGDQFAEYLEINEGVESLVEELLDALYDKDVVAWHRKRFGARRSPEALEGPQVSPATQVSGKEGRKPQGAS